MSDDVIIEANGARVVLRPMTNRARVRQFRAIQALSGTYPHLFNGDGDGLDDGLAWGFVMLVARHRESSGLNFPVPSVEQGKPEAIVAAYEAFLDDTNTELGTALINATRNAEPDETADPNAESGARKGKKGSKPDSAEPPAAS